MLLDNVDYPERSIKEKEIDKSAAKKKENSWQSWLQQQVNGTNVFRVVVLVFLAFIARKVQKM